MSGKKETAYQIAYYKVCITNYMTLKSDTIFLLYLTNNPQLFTGQLAKDLDIASRNPSMLCRGFAFQLVYNFCGHSLLAMSLRLQGGYSLFQDARLGQSEGFVQVRVV